MADSEAVTVSLLADLRTLEAIATPGRWGLKPQEGPREVTLKRRHWEVFSRSTGKGIGILFGDDEVSALLAIACRNNLLTLLDAADDNRPVPGGDRRPD